VFARSAGKERGAHSTGFDYALDNLSSAVGEMGGPSGAGHSRDSLNLLPI
jgi:hypothetical protein